MSSPAVQKSQTGTPKTPTKLGRKPAPLSSAKSVSTKAQDNAKPSTPTKLKSGNDEKNGSSAVSKPDMKQSKDQANEPTSQLSDKAKDSGRTTSQAHNKAKNSTDAAAAPPLGKAKDSAPHADDAAKDVTGGATDKAGQDMKKLAQGQESLAHQEQDDDEPLSKVQQDADDNSELKQAAPVPVKDDDDDNDNADDTVAGAKDQAEDAAEKAQDTAKDTTDKADDTVEDMSDQAHETTQAATEQAQDTAEDTADDVTEKVGALGETSADETNDDKSQTQDSEGGLLKGARGLAGRASQVADKAAQQPKKAAEQTSGNLTRQAKSGAGQGEQTAQGTADSTTDAADDTADAAKNKLDEAQDSTDNQAQDVEDTAGDEQAEDAKDTVGDATQDVEQLAEDSKDAVDEGAEERRDSAQEDVDGAQRTAEDAKDQAQQGADETQDAAEGTEPPEGLPLDYSVLKGLEVQGDGLVRDSEGNAIGRLVEGDAEDLEGYPIGDDAEILDEDEDLVGRIELLPEEIKRQLSKAKKEGAELPEGADEYLSHLEEQREDEQNEEPPLPGLEVLEGLTCGADGLIYDNDGNTIGKVTDGDPEQLQHATLNKQGEFVDENGEVIGTATIHEEAAQLVEQGVYDAADDAQDLADAAENAAGKAEDAADEPKQDIEDELPGIEALQGRELNEDAEIVDDAGEVLGHIQDEELKQKIEDGEIDVKDLHIDEEGQVVDADGNVLGSTELAEGAAEKLAGIAPDYDVRILEHRKVNKRGKILDDDGEEIGQLVEGDQSACTAKKVNAKGEVLDKSGKVIGKVKVSEGQAAQEATQRLREESEEQQDDTAGDRPSPEVLDGLKVNKKAQVLNEDGEPIGELIEGELSDCIGKKCNEKGEVLSDGSVIGRVQTLPSAPEEEPQHEEAAEQEQEPEEAEQQQEQSDLPPLSVLEGLKVNKSSKILDAQGNIIGELIEGDAKKLSKAGTTCDAEGQFWDNKGHVIGRAQTIKQEDADEESPFAGLEGLKVIEGGWVQDSEGNKVGRVTEGDAKRLIGRSVDEDGDVLDKKGSVVGHADRYEEEEPEPEEEEQAPDLSFLQGKTVNKAGLVIDDGVPIARLVEGKQKETANRKLDSEGKVWNDSGKVIGRVELIPEDEREQKADGPFAGYTDLKVIKDGKVADSDDNVVGIIVEGDAKRLAGLSVDEDGDIADRHGNVKGHAEPYEEPEEEKEAPEDLSALNGTTINKAAHAVDSSGAIIGHVVEGDPKKMINKKVDGQGQVWDNAGNVIGRCELARGEDNAAEGPFSGFENLKVQKDGTVATSAGDIVGRVVEGDVKKLQDRQVDADGDVLDSRGNRLGRAERWEPEEKERRKNPMSGMRVNKQGEVRDENGDLVGRLTDGTLGHCVGQEINDNGDVIDQDSNKIGEVTLLENIVEEEYEGPTEEELEEAKKREQEREIAAKMSSICSQTLERMQPICKQITEYMEAADRTPKDELDEEDLVNKVKPLIEEGGRILQECNGSLRGLDPDGKIAAQAKGRAGTGEATPEEVRLAETLKELTTTVVTTIDNAKKKLNDMPHARKKLNPLWALLTQPLFQILAAVGLLLAGVLGLVGQLLNGLGLGGLVNGLLGGLGIDKLLSSFGLGGRGHGHKKKGGNPIGNLPVIGGLLGGK